MITRRPTHERRALFTLAAGGLLAACGQQSGGSPGAGATQAGEPAGSAGGSAAAGGAGLRVQAVVPSTDLAVGRNRFALGVLQTPRGTTVPVPTPDADLRLKFFYPIEPQPVPRGEEVTPAFRYVADKSKGLYVAEVEFDQAGDWGVQVDGTYQGQPLTTNRIRFPVKAKSDTPALGAPAPRSRNPTRRDVDDIRKIDTAATPTDLEMHDLSIAEALEQGKPLVVLFASPGFCTTATCTPQVGEVDRLRAKYGSQVNFVHVEIFKDPMTRTPYETVTEWALTSEPWTFFVDKRGLVAEKYEGPAPFAEMEPPLQRLL